MFGHLIRGRSRRKRVEAVAALAIPVQIAAVSEATTAHVVTSVSSPGGRPLPVEFRVEPEAVEVWVAGRRRAAITQRDILGWSVTPTLSLTIEDVTLTVNAQGWLVLAVPESCGWILPRQVFTALVARL